MPLLVAAANIDGANLEPGPTQPRVVLLVEGDAYELSDYEAMTLAVDLNNAARGQLGPYVPPAALEIADAISCDRDAGSRPWRRWWPAARQNRRNLLEQLDATAERAATDHLESHVGVLRRRSAPGYFVR